MGRDSMLGFGNMLKDYLEYYKISQTDFANRLNISQKHMNEILNENADISIELMLAISLITDIDPKLILLVENKKNVYNYLQKKFKNENEINKFLNGFYLKEMAEKKWIKLKDKDSYIQKAVDLLDYLNVRNFDMLDNYLDNRILYKKKDNTNNKKIYLWINRCDDLVKNQKTEDYNPKNLPLLLEELKNEQNNNFNENRLIKIFNKYGIYLVIEDALKGSKIRGCMMVKGDTPTIYMTKYLKEKSSFYFTLYHEIGHIKTDYNKAKSKIIIEDDENEIIDNETKIDLFAITAMIDSKIWEEIKICKSYNQMETICKQNKIPLCFLYSRLAKENMIKYNDALYIKNRESI